MRIIEIRPSGKFGGSWVAYEAGGIEPANPAANGKEHAISYARGRFGGFPSGAIAIYDERGEKIVETIKVDGGTEYGEQSF